MSVDNARTFLQQAQAIIAQALGELGPAAPAVDPNLIFVRKGDNLQKAIDSAPVGATIRVYPDIYDGIVLRGRTANLTIMPDTSALVAGTRVGPASVPAMIQLRANAGSLPTNIVNEPQAQGYTLIGFAPIPGRPDVAMAQLGDDKVADPAQQPGGIVFDRCLFLADPVKGGKRGISMNTRDIAVINSYFDGFWWQDDSQALSAWNGCGPFTILNNYLSSSGENVMFGGADAAAVGMLPANLTMRFNYCTKQPSWQGVAGHTVKDTLELKAMLTALIEYNVFEYSWKSGQVGFAMDFTPRNQNGSAPFTQVRDITFRNNVIRNVAAGFQILGVDNLAASQRTTNLRILNNLIYHVDPAAIYNPAMTTPNVGSGRLLQVTGGPVQVEVGHNTMIGKNLNSFLSLDGATPKTDQLNIHDNVFSEGSYGMIGTGLTPGQASWDGFVTNGVFEHNLIARQTTARTVKYPGAVVYETAVGEDAVDPTTLLLAAKFAALASSDGTPLGANVADLLAKIPGFVI